MLLYFIVKYEKKNNKNKVLIAVASSARESDYILMTPLSKQYTASKTDERHLFSVIHFSLSTMYTRAQFFKVSLAQRAR